MHDVLPTGWAPDEARQLGDWIRSEREQQALSRGQLAAQMGYQNLSKGASRVASWETGRDYPRGDRLDVLREALGHETDAPLKLLDAFLVAAEQRRQVIKTETLRQSRVAFAELHLLQRHHALLLSHTGEICGHADRANIRIGDAIVQLAYIGSTTLSLADVLSGWQGGPLHVSAPTGPFYLLRIAGSPLSGRHQVTGFRPDEDGLQYRQIEGFAQRASALLKHRSPPHVASDCLAGLLSRLGVEIPDLTITDDESGDTYRYRYATRCVTGPFGTLDLSLRFEAPTQDTARWTPRWDNDGANKRVLNQLTPVQTGVWRGDALVLHSRTQRAWTATPGVLTDERSERRYTLSAVAPPALLTWLLEAR